MVPAARLWIWILRALGGFTWGLSSCSQSCSPRDYHHDDCLDHDNKISDNDDLMVHRQLDPVRHPRVLFSIPGGRLVLRPCHLLARLFHPYNPFSSYFESFLTAVNPIELIVTTCACGAQRSSQGSQLLTVMFGTIRASPRVKKERQR